MPGELRELRGGQLTQTWVGVRVWVQEGSIKFICSFCWPRVISIGQWHSAIFIHFLNKHSQNEVPVLGTIKYRDDSAMGIAPPKAGSFL